MAVCTLLLAAACATGADRATPSPDGQAAGEITPPEPGTYVYEISGRSLDPDDPERVLNSVDRVELIEEVTADGDTFTSEITTEGSPGVVTRIETRWERDRLLLVSSDTESEAGGSTCAFEPPVTVTRIPIRAGDLPTQTWETEGCSGSIDVSVVGRATAPDATGQRWETWKLEVRTETSAPGVSTVETETRWLSPELGKEIRSERVAEGERGERRFHNVTQTALRSHP